MNETSVKTLGWLLAILTPIALFAYLGHEGTDRHVTLFTAVAATTIVLWVFDLMSELIPALLALLAVLVFGLAPESVALSGFSSTAFLLAFSIMGLGVVIVESGLTYRYTLLLLRKLPSNTFTHQLAVFLTGFAFTPIVPTIIGRASIVAPVMTHMTQGWDPETRRRSSTMLYTTGLDSIHYLAPWFLTAAPANLMVYALLPPQDQQAFHFMFWAFAASVTGLGLLLLYFLASWLFFRTHGRVALDHAQIDREWRLLGPITPTERAALVGIVLLGLGIITAPYHKLEVQYVAFGVLCLLLYLGALSRSAFIAKIDWAFLALLASIIGLMATMKYLHIDKLVMAQMGGLGSFMRYDFGLFVLILSALVLLVRLAIPLNSAILILAAAIMPIADQAGVTPWVVGFVILIMAETAFFAYQSPYIFFFRSLAEGIDYSERRVRLFHLLLIPCKLAAIYASIPFWRQIGVL